MRGTDERQSPIFSFVDLEDRVPPDHPLRPVKELVDDALNGLNRDFDQMHAEGGRPSIAPEKLLRALLVQVLFTVRSERMLMEQLSYNLLFRWFVGLGIDEAVWDASTFTKNRNRLLEHDIARKFFAQVLGQARMRDLLSDEHFTVDGTFIDAWASQKSFKRKDSSDGDDPNQGGRNQPVDFHGEKRSNDTHASVTDPDARLMRKGNTGAKLVHHGHVLTENRHGLVVDATVTIASGTAEREAALNLLKNRSGRKAATVGADKGYDQQDFVDAARKVDVTPHVAQNTSNNRRSKIDGRTTRHPGYAISQRRRKMVEEVFGWMKTIGLMHKVRHRGTELVDSIFVFAAAAYNLVRLRNIIHAATKKVAA